MGNRRNDSCGVTSHTKGCSTHTVTQPLISAVCRLSKWIHLMCHKCADVLAVTPRACLSDRPAAETFMYVAESHSSVSTCPTHACIYFLYFRVWRSVTQIWHLSPRRNSNSSSANVNHLCSLWPWQREGALMREW